MRRHVAASAPVLLAALLLAGVAPGQPPEAAEPAPPEAAESAPPEAEPAHPVAELLPDPAAARPPTVRAVRFTDDRPLEPEDRVALDALVGHPATDDALDALVRALARADRPGLDLRLAPADDPALVDVIVHPEPRVRRVGRLRVTTAPVGAPDPEGDRRLMRRIEGLVAPFALEEGHVFHPWLERRDTARVRRYFVEQGHPFARVEARRFDSPGVVDLTWRVDPGPRVAIAEVRVSGLPDPADRPQLETVAGERQAARPWVLAADAERVRRHVCLAGFPDARVDVTAEVRRGRLAVEFAVAPGVPARIAAVDIDAPPLPRAVLAEPPLTAGDPWCPDAADAAASALRRRLEAAARPDADVRWTAEIAPPDGRLDAPRAVRLALTIRDARTVRIERVWFAGNRVTRVDLLRELVTVEPGDLYDPDAIDASVQALRRTALFRRVDARTVPGPDPGTRHLLFTLVEREPFSIDLEQQSLTLHNLDLTDTTTDVRALRAGAALRGAGQRMVLYAQPEWQGLHLFDPYILPILGAEARLDRRTRGFGADVEESWYSLQGDVALRLLADRVIIAPAVLYALTFPEGVSSGAGLPVADDVTLLGALGLRGEARFARLDDERVPYLGARLDARVWRALPAIGSDLDLTRLDVDLDLRLPLRRFEGDRHLVLGVILGASDITRHGPRELAAHQRVTPKIRGFAPLRFRHPVGEETLRLGGQVAFTGAVELRVPMPYARRHALLPSLDAAALGDRGRDPFDAVFAAPALTYVYSFFDEKLEGFLRVAFPLRTDVDLEYIAFGMDGSF